MRIISICLFILFSHGLSYGQNNFKDMSDSVKEKAEILIKSGFNAGDGYGEVWIRDMNTFIEIACKVNDKELIKKHLITFFQFQQPDGGILDGYIPNPKGSGINYKYYHTKLAPEYAGHKNTVETDQESSLVQAISKYIKSTGDKSILKTIIAEETVQQRLEKAMKFLLTERFDKMHGLIWGATTADWGDVQPEHEWGVEIDSNTHKAIDIYDNAMFVIAINDYLELAELNGMERNYWIGVRNDFTKNIRKYLWDKKNQKFKPHVYLNGSPFPDSFNESEIYYHGGTIVAIEANLLNKAEVKTAYIKMKEDMKKANAATIGLTLFPVYPKGLFKNPGMSPYSYQNGGDWTWFGGRMIPELIRFGYLDEAKEALTPMLQRVIANNGFYEWYTPENKPQGSSSFRGEAGVLWSAITQIQAAYPR